MSYEFNPESQVFEFPNPYKIENSALITSGIVMLLAGIIAMIGVRSRIDHNMDGRPMFALLISIALLIFGIVILARAFTQLRYFFGRNRPDNLAPTVRPDKDGNSGQANSYKEILRQNAIIFREPTGPLNGLLYSWLPHLIFAPRVIQESAQTQFSNFLSLTATTISFMLCWFMFGNSPANGWIGFTYGAFGFFQIMRPMVKRSTLTTSAINEGNNVGIGSLIFLIILAVLGPVILGMNANRLPNLDGLSINGVVIVALLCALAGSAVFGFALKNQLQPPPQAVGAARVTETVTMNSHPNKLIEELDRSLMSRWYSNIPNRRYTRKSPTISGEQGAFTAELFEETQPRPQSNRVANNIAHALSTPQFFWLTCLTGLATIYCFIGSIVALICTRNLLNGAPIASSIALALSEFAVGLFCYRAAHLLWGRFDFVSELIWVDINGSFESAKMQIGNQLSGNVHTAKNVTNIEMMTMRVWVSEISTVIFGKDAPRQLTGMLGLPNMAQELATTLKQFGEERSMIVAPNSPQDIERAQKIGAVNTLISGATTPNTEQLDALLAATTNKNLEHQANVSNEVHETAQTLTPQTTQQFCIGCGGSLQKEAKFCSQCGKAVS